MAGSGDGPQGADDPVIEAVLKRDQTRCRLGGSLTAKSFITD